MLKNHLAGLLGSLSLGLTILSPAPGNAQGLRVEVVRTIGREVGLGIVLGGTVGPDGSVYVVDMSNACVWKFAAGSDSVTKMGAAGQGPGEFNRVYRVAVRQDGKILVYDLSTGEVSLFTAAGRFESRVKLSLGLRQVGSFITVGNNLVLTGSAIRAGPISDSAVHVFDKDLKYVRSFGAAPSMGDPRKLEYLGTGFVTPGANGTILYTHREGYTVEIFRLDGRRLRNIAVQRPLKGKLEDGIQLADSSGRFSVHSDFAGIETAIPAVAAPQGNLLAGRLLDHKTAMDLIDTQGRVVDSTAFADPLGILGAGPTQGTYWVMTAIDDEPVVQLVRVTRTR